MLITFQWTQVTPQMQGFVQKNESDIASWHGIFWYAMPHFILYYSHHQCSWHLRQWKIWLPPTDCHCHHDYEETNIRSDSSTYLSGQQLNIPLFTTRSACVLTFTHFWDYDSWEASAWYMLLVFPVPTFHHQSSPTYLIACAFLAYTNLPMLTIFVGMGIVKNFAQYYPLSIISC